MSGKSYTMREMKLIVDYLTEHKAYGDTKARKMWMDFANSNLTNRTWQSLKETFLKRILPDIQNPYYNLTMDQIRSFRQGYDVTMKDKNKLEIFSVHDDSSSSVEIKTESLDPGTSKQDENIPSVEDLQKELEASSNAAQEEPKQQENDQTTSPTKSSRDCIMYSEPLTPMMQDILNDFASDADGSDNEPPLQIVEESDGNNHDGSDGDFSDQVTKNLPKNTEANKNNDQEFILTAKQVVEAVLEDDIQDTQTSKSKSLKLKKTHKDKANAKNKTIEDKTSNDTRTENEINTFELLDKQNKNLVGANDKISQNTNNSVIDSLLPNNQEELNGKRTSDANKPLVSKESTKDENLVKPTNSIENEELNSAQVEMTKAASPIAIPDPIPEGEKLESNKQNEENNTKIVNPCLQSVSLFEEQLQANKGSDSENNQTKTEEAISPEVKKRSEKNSVNVENEIVVLHSQSEDSGEPSARKTLLKKNTSDKSSALAKLFGYSSGLTSARKRNISKRKSNYFQRTNLTSDSSEWTSESDNEYVSPPRGKRHKHTKKFLKPKSSRVFSLDEEGGLFVMLGKKILPVVKDSRILKNYLTYTPESEEEEESHWKLKYVQEKKKNDELTKLLEDAKEIVRSVSPILHSSTSRRKVVPQSEQPTIDSMSSNVKVAESEVKADMKDDKTVKIKFTKKNEEVQLEGHWSQLNPVLDRIVQLYNNSEAKKEEIVPNLANTNRVSISSTRSSIADQDVHEKIDKIENEIFSEIQERDRETTTEVNIETSNVTLRKRGRATKVPKAASKSPQYRAKKQKTDVETELNENKRNLEVPSISETLPNISKTKSSDSMKATETKKSTRIAKKTKPEDNETSKSPAIVDENDVLYRFPSPELLTENVQNRKSVTNKTKYSSDPIPPPDIFSLNSIDSTQGYQDSDVSPTKLTLRKKRRISLSTLLYRERTRIQRRRCKSFTLSRRPSEDTVTCFKNFISKPINNSSSTNTESYMTESYQAIMGKPRKSLRVLDKIDEYVPINTNDQKSTEVKKKYIETTSNNSVGGSSNVSLPHSPELSIVENISLDKTPFKDIDYPTINETQYNNKVNINVDDKSKYEMSKVDITLPLMEQDVCIKNNEALFLASPNSPKRRDMRSPTVTDSLLNKLSHVNIDSSETLENKIRDLFLESAKKLVKSSENADQQLEPDKAKATKRCSTPRKRKSTRKMSAPNVETVVEEHMEYCCYAPVGRNSCPPLSETKTHLDVVKDNNNRAQRPQAKKAANIKKKKDIIKVKITRPRKSKGNNKIITVNDESGKFIHDDNDSIELIHNHSETCLQAKECVSDSVEILEATESYNITIDSNSSCSNRCNRTGNGVLSDIFCNNAQDVSSLFSEKRSTYSMASDSGSITINTPSKESYNSLLTEDLSVELPSKSTTKWYLCDEEMTNFPESRVLTLGSKLTDIFPITCAVPNLSIITEMSKDNEQNSRPKIEEFDSNDIN